MNNPAEEMSSKFLPLLVLGLLFLTLLCHGPTLCQATDYYVTPTDSSNPDCSVGEPCFTVDYYAQEFSNTSYQDGTHNITLIFLQGTHNLTQNLVVRNSSVLVLRGISDASSVVVLLNANVTVLCEEATVSIELKSLKVIGSSIQSFSITIRQPSSLQVERLVLYNTLLSVFAQLAFAGNVKITESEFRCSSVDVELKDCKNVSISILSSSFSANSLTNAINVVGSESMFLLQVHDTTVEDISTELCQSKPGFTSSPVCDLNVNALGVSDINNSAAIVNVTNSRFLRSYTTGVCQTLNNFNAYITDSIVSNHNGGAFFVSLINVGVRPKVNVTIKGCNISNNTFVPTNLTPKTIVSAGLSIILYATNPHETMTIRIENTMFLDNYPPISSAVINLMKIVNVTIHNCHFTNNTGSPIVAYQSNFTLSGNSSFEDNIAVKGGALSLSLSAMNIINGSDIVFRNNSASDVGGAIYVQQQNVGLYLNNDVQTATECFYQLLGDLDPSHYSLSFVNNTAVNGGDHVFGASILSYCVAAYYGDFTLTSYDVRQIFHFDPTHNSDLSPVSSIPTRVCLCDSDGQFDCINVSQVFHSRHVSPGEEFSISAVVVGSEFGTAQGSAYAQFLPINGQEAKLSQQYQYTHGIRNDRNCSLLNYSVLSANHEEVIVLTTTERSVLTYADYETLQTYAHLGELFGVIPPQLLTTPVYVNVTMLPCPLGFVLVGTPPRCDCYEIFKENNISCRVAGGGNGYVTRNKTQWVNASFNGENITGVFLHKYCPFGYCDPQPVTVDLTHDPDKQCAFNRSGILCGACKPGYSSVLGSSKCRKCSNSYLALIIVFVVAGILLVLFIKLLDLTVAHGTINGLIFYANIVWANQSILFPNDGHANGATMILKTFIAWLNLDFGIETCFFNGLDGYWKTWLQFVFPFYIWSIAGVIIITMRHSTLLTRLFGNNSVSVLATLFLLSYSKLLRTIITALNVTYLVDYPDGYRLAVWSFDGNLKYCGIPHVFLFCFALIFLLALWMPYTAVLLLIQLLRKVSNWKIFRWVNKMKPIFDAYFSPLKDRHHYWFGVQLIARGILLIIFSQTSSNIPAANYVAMTTVSAALLFYVAQTGYLYKKLYVSFLETSFLLNLVLLGGGALFVNLTDGNETALIFISVGIAFVQFVAILLIHFQKTLKGCYQKFRHVKREEYGNIQEADDLASTKRQNITISHVDSPLLQDSENNPNVEFREPLLED